MLYIITSIILAGLWLYIMGKAHSKFEDLDYNYDYSTKKHWITIE